MNMLNFGISLDTITWGVTTAKEVIVSGPYGTPVQQMHYNRICSADLQYPVLIYFDDQGIPVILDGNHRMAKALLNVSITINCIVVSDEILEKCEIIW